MPLENEIHEAFAEHFCLNGGNATAAARTIGIMASPGPRGHDMLHRPEVQARILELSGTTTLPKRVVHRVGSAKVSEFEAAVKRFIELCGPL